MNTNMHVEAFHSELKYVYMKGKVNKRCENCIYVLLKLAGDKRYERLVKIEKGNNTERVSYDKSTASVKFKATLHICDCN